MKTDVIIPSRFKSERLPGKCLLDMAGESNLKRIIRRCLLCTEINNVILAVAEGKDNNPIIEYYNIQKMVDPMFASVKLFIGDPENVIARTISAAETFGTEIIVDVTHDCTFLSWEIMHHLIRLQKTFDLEYCSNVIERTYPDGFDLQVYSLAALKEVNKIIPPDSKMRYHTGWNIVHYKDQLPSFRLMNLPAPSHFEYPKWRIVLDEPADYNVLYKISEHFVKSKGVKYEPTISEIMNLIKSSPGILTNRNVKAKEVGQG